MIGVDKSASLRGLSGESVSVGGMLSVLLCVAV